jgi:hypothetical protein
MRATVSSSRSISRTAIAAGVGAVALAAAAIALWARYGAAVFHEMIVAGLALCF